MKGRAEVRTSKQRQKEWAKIRPKQKKSKNKTLPRIRQKQGKGRRNKKEPKNPVKGKKKQKTLRRESLHKCATFAAQKQKPEGGKKQRNVLNKRGDLSQKE